MVTINCILILVLLSLLLLLVVVEVVAVVAVVVVVVAAAFGAIVTLRARRVDIQCVAHRKPENIFVYMASTSARKLCGDSFTVFSVVQT